MGRKKNKRTPKTPFETAKRTVDDVYNVEEIRAKRRSQGRTMYEVKWESHPSPENTWEPLENLEGAEDTIVEFEKAWAAKYAEDTAREASVRQERLAAARADSLEQARALNAIDVAAARERTASTFACSVLAKALIVVVPVGRLGLPIAIWTGSTSASTTVELFQKSQK